ncbi:unnamed protein product [Periconia digitata]|uniref:Uncharacterized protein n=1 Tax=Periconia digitata TaxID=1303443 RepID=A0A9W4XN38_9PLEO|nr:unnamed protein product [Periconia digitata]
MLCPTRQRNIPIFCDFRGQWRWISQALHRYEKKECDMSVDELYFIGFIVYPRSSLPTPEFSAPFPPFLLPRPYNKQSEEKQSHSSSKTSPWKSFLGLTPSRPLKTPAQSTKIQARRITNMRLRCSGTSGAMYLPIYI